MAASYIVQTPGYKYTPWFPGNINPAYNGVYMTSNEQAKGYGNSYAYWNGLRWEPYKYWGRHFDKMNIFVWRGLDKKA